MSEISLNASTETIPVEAMIEGQPIGIWLDGQREVLVQTLLDTQSRNPQDREALLNRVVMFQWVGLSPEEAKEASTLQSAFIHQIDQRLIDETNPKLKAFLELWLKQVSAGIDFSIAHRTEIGVCCEMDLFKKALSTTHLRDRHIIYQELVKRQVNNHLSKGIIDSTFKEMAQNAEKLQTEELSDFIQAVLEGKEPPKMTLPQLQVYELAVKSNVNLSCQDLLEEMFAFAKGIEESATFLERMGLNVEIASVFRDKIVKVAESYRTSLSPYKDKVKEDHLNDKFPRGILHFLILHHTGEIYKQDHFTHGSKFYSHEAKHAKEFLDVAKGFIAAARITIKEKPEEGERLLQLIKTAYVDQYMYLGWFNRRDDAYYRVQALIELGEVAHEFGLPCASSFKKEARQLKWDCLFGDPRVPSLL